MGVKLIVCGYPRSGNMLLRKEILCKLFSKTDWIFLADRELYRSKVKKTLYRREEIDNLNSFIMATHDTIGQIKEFFPYNAKGIYLVRDGRAALNSRIHYVVRKDKFKPDYKHTTVEAVYSDLALFERYAAQWGIHVQSFLEHRNHYSLYCFEDLAYNTVDVLGRLLRELNVTDIDPAKIADEVSFNSLQRKNPLHYRSGKIEEWKQCFTNEHKKIFKRVAGEALISLGYEKDNNW